MNIELFLESFSDLPDAELHTLRRTPRLDEWPADASLYLDLAKQAFPGPSEDRERRQRFVRLLREFLYHDGRTFGALMYITEQASKAPEEYGANGINSLAGIYCYLNMDREAPVSDEELVANFERYADVHELSVNARQCLRVLSRRRPELRSKILDHPPKRDRTEDSIDDF